MASRKSRVAKSATEALRILWEEGFLRGWKKMGEIEDNLGERGNHFSPAELGMALKRAKHLTRRGRPGSYEYIQRYPFVAEESSHIAKEEGAHGTKRHQTGT
jgi:hypothetical protein